MYLRRSETRVIHSFLLFASGSRGKPYTKSKIYRMLKPLCFAIDWDPTVISTFIFDAPSHTLSQNTRA